MPKREYNVELFTEEQLKKYHNDPRWAKVTKLTKACKFSECNELTLKIMQDHECFNYL